MFTNMMLRSMHERDLRDTLNKCMTECEEIGNYRTQLDSYASCKNLPNSVRGELENILRKSTSDGHCFELIRKRIQKSKKNESFVLCVPIAFLAALILHNGIQMGQHYNTDLQIQERNQRIYSTSLKNGRVYESKLGESNEEFIDADGDGVIDYMKLSRGDKIFLVPIRKHSELDPAKYSVDSLKSYKMIGNPIKN